MSGNSELDLSAAAFVHPSALIYGKVRMGEGSSIWCNAVIRSEAAHVDIGAYTNVQDFVMIHTDPGRPVVIGTHCSITHHATIHGSTIGNNVLIGINATIYGGAVIGAIFIKAIGGTARHIMLNKGVADNHPFDHTLGHDHLFFPVKQLIFDRGAAAVQRHDNHLNPPCE